MPGSSSSSFIPKHTPNKPERRNSPRQVFFGTLLVRILFVATLVAALGVFLYVRKLDNQLMVEVTNFKAETMSYEADADKLAAVVAMNKRLLAAKSIFDQSVSVNSLFTAIERSVIGTVRLESLEIGTNDVQGQISLTATIKTDGFDSTMFQRSVLQDSEVFATTTIEDVSVGVTSGAEGEEVKGEINFKASILVDPKTIPALVVSDDTFVPLPEPVVESESVNTDSAADAIEEDPEVGVGFDAST